MSGRVLLVDDHAAWRENVRSILRTSDRWQTVEEAADGGAAVEKAQRLEPHVIVLDVSLPVLNGLEAAKRILALRPGTRILFVSLHRSLDIVEAAFLSGGRGYLLKANHAELLQAMESVAAGRYYLSSAFTARTSPDPPSHEIGSYDDARMVAEYARFGADALHAGKALVFVAAATRRHHVRAALQARGLDVDRVLREGRYIEFDVAELLSQLIVDDRVDDERFWTTGTAMFLSAAKASRGARSGVAACGDGAATLLQDRKVDLALRLEQLWDEFARTYNVDILCGYPCSVVSDDADRDVARKICAVHSAVRTP